MSDISEKSHYNFLKCTAASLVRIFVLVGQKQNNLSWAKVIFKIQQTIYIIKAVFPIFCFLLK